MDWQYEPVMAHTSNLRSTLQRQILIVMPVDCKYDTHVIINSIQYNPSTTALYWYFNVYNKHKCKNKNYSLNTDTFSNVRVIYEPIYKIIFWIRYVAPKNIQKSFNNIIFDYIFFIDEDMLLSEFHFEEFIRISLKLNSSISQPSLKMIDDQPIPYVFPALWDQNNKYQNIVAKQIEYTEIMATLFSFKSWEIIHPYIVNTLSNISNCNNTNWGPNLWWCRAIRSLINGSCIVVHYTPMNKTGDFYQRGDKCLKYQKSLYSKWYANPTENKAIKLFYADSILPNNINSNYTLNFDELKQSYPQQQLMIKSLQNALNAVDKKYKLFFRSNSVAMQQLLTLNYDTLYENLGIASNRARKDILHTIKILYKNHTIMAMEDIHIVMCTFNRIENLLDQINCLNRQTVSHRIKFHILNNNKDYAQKVHNLIVAINKTSIIDIFLSQYENEYYGFQRFIYIRDVLLKKYICNFVLIIDDDQIFSYDWVESMYHLKKPQTFITWYGRSWTNNNSLDYWNVKDSVSLKDCLLNQKNHIAYFNYGGTGGSIIDTSIFNPNSNLWDIPYDLPKGVTVYNMEDLWLSFIITKYYNWTIQRSFLPIKILSPQIEEKTALWKTLLKIKQQLFEYLVYKKQWAIF